MEEKNREVMTEEKETEKNGAKEYFRNYFKAMKLDTKSIARNAIVAALYTALTYAFFFCSYGQVQVRVSEFMILLVFFNPNYIYGLTIGCILSNIYAPAMSAFCTPLDIVMGTAATIIALILISLSRHLLLATIFPALSNGFLLAWEFTFLANTEGTGNAILFWTNFGFVALGEVIAVSVLGYTLFRILTKKSKRFLSIIDAKQNLNYKW